ncbi:MAG: transposase, partial [Lachnospiraceae bacterium]|nr:transposase [Lachnospiraceae bacterium]
MTGNREYKSDVFSMLMEDPVNALELYNAMNGSAYTDPGMVSMCRLDGGISLSIRNDAAFVLDMMLSIYEHQSTVCPNMPLRNFFYLANIWKKAVKNRELLSREHIKLPTPKFAVFYNGEEEQPEQYELKLSDAFERPIEDPELELKCMVYNINSGKNESLKSRCPFLREYMIFVDYVRGYLEEEKDSKDLERAINRAIDRCMEENVLKEFLTERRDEVVKVMTLDYTFERRLELTKRDATANGMVAGEVQKLIQLTCKKYQKGLTVEETAEMFEEDTETIGKIYDAIKTTGTDDVEEI